MIGCDYYEPYLGAGRTDPLSRSVFFVKPIYSSYINLLNISLSDISSESINCDISAHTELPFRGILDNLGIANINQQDIKINNEEIILTENLELKSVHSFASTDTVIINQRVEEEIPWDDQLLIDKDHSTINEIGVIQRFT